MIKVPPTVITYYNAAEVSTDAMHLNDMPFLTSTCHDIYYGTSLAVDNFSCLVLEQGLNIVIR